MALISRTRGARDEREAALVRGIVWALCVAACAGVFVLYLQPSIVVDLANRLWSCF